MIICCKNNKKVEKEYHFKRFVPKGLKVAVEKGDKVKKDTILASGQLALPKTRIDVSSELSVKPDDTKRYLKCLNGERVVKGDLLASKKGKIITKEKNIKAPCNGVISLSEIKNGILVILDVAKETTVNSGVNGNVASVIRNKYIDILCRVLKVKPFFIKGKSVQGELFYLEKEEANIEIGTNLRGGIVVIDFRPNTELLRRLALADVSGIIVGGMRSKLLSEMNSHGLWGMTVCAIEGFGNIAIGENLRSILSKNDNYLTLLDTKRAELILTKVKKSKESKTRNKLVREVKLKDRVQILDTRAWGEYGIVEEIHKYAVKVRADKKDIMEVSIHNLVLE